MRKEGCTSLSFHPLLICWHISFRIPPGDHRTGSYRSPSPGHKSRRGRAEGGSAVGPMGNTRNQAQLYVPSEVNITTLFYMVDGDWHRPGIRPSSHSLLVMKPGRAPGPPDAPSHACLLLAPQPCPQQLTWEGASWFLSLLDSSWDPRHQGGKGCRSGRKINFAKCRLELSGQGWGCSVSGFFGVAGKWGPWGAGLRFRWAPADHRCF